MILDIWVLMLCLKLLTEGGKVKIPTQPLRILRLLKLTRMARLMKAFPELVVMIGGSSSNRIADFPQILLAIWGPGGKK